jgi:hypothetical protein
VSKPRIDRGYFAAALTRDQKGAVAPARLAGGRCFLPETCSFQVINIKNFLKLLSWHWVCNSYSDAGSITGKSTAKRAGDKEWAF